MGGAATSTRNLAVIGLLASALLAVPRPALAGGLDIRLAPAVSYADFGNDDASGESSSGTWSLSGTRFDAATERLQFQLHVRLSARAGLSSGPIVVLWTIKGQGYWMPFNDLDEAVVEPDHRLAARPRCTSDETCTADFNLNVKAGPAIAVAGALRRDQTRDISLAPAITVMRTLGRGSMFQVLNVGHRSGAVGSLRHPLPSHGTFLNGGFRPVDQDFTNGRFGPPDLLVAYRRAVAAAGLSVASGKAPTWHAAAMDLAYAADCNDGQVVGLTDQQGNHTLVESGTTGGGVSAHGVIPASGRWTLGLDWGGSWFSVLVIPDGLTSVALAGTVDCDDPAASEVTVTDAGPVDPSPPSLPALPATDTVEPGQPETPGSILLLMGAALTACAWLLRFRRLTG